MKFTYVLLAVGYTVAVFEPASSLKLNDVSFIQGPWMGRQCGITVQNVTGMIQNFTQSDSFEFNIPPVNVEHHELNGTYSSNGTITGLSGVSFTYILRPILGTRNLFLQVNLTTQDPIQLRGFYDIQNGTINIKGAGNSTFSGTGRLDSTFTGASIVITGTVIGGTFYNPSVARANRISFNMTSGNFTAQDFVVNGEQVDWEVVNEEAVPFYESVQNEVQKELLGQLNKILNGCTYQHVRTILGVRSRPIWVGR